MQILASVAAVAFVCSCYGTASAQEAPPSHLTEMQMAQEIVDRGFPEDQRMAMFPGFASELIKQLRTAMPATGQVPKIDAAVDRYIGKIMVVMEEVLADHMDDLMGSLVVAYAESLEREQLEGLHSFIMSPAGEGFLAKSANVMQNPTFANANMGYMADYMPKAQQLQSEFQSEIMQIAMELEASK